MHRLCAKPTDLKWLRNKVLFGSFPDGIKMVGLTQMSLLWKSQKWTAGRLEKDKGQTSCFLQSIRIFLNFRIQEEDQIWFDDDVFVGELPDCNTSEMIEALDGKYIFSQLGLFIIWMVNKYILTGHFSLVHERFASPEHIMETNNNVEEWKKQLENLLKVHK